MPTNRLKLLLGTILGVIVVGGLAYGQVKNTQEIVKLEQSPVVITKTVIVTPTVVPSATPSATIKTRISTPASVTKGIK